MFPRPEELPFLTDDLILSSTLTGTKQALIEDIRTLEKAGYRQLTIQIVEGQEAAIDDWADVFSAV